MHKQWPKSLGKKVELLINVPECTNKNYKRENTPSEIRKKIIQRDEGKCFLCGTKPKAILVHHIKPLGDSTENNLVVMCNTCHVWIHRLLNKMKGYKSVRTYTSYW